MPTTRIAGSLAVLVALALVLATAGCPDSSKSQAKALPKQAKPVDPLVREFGDAYPAEAPTPVAQHRLVMRAAPAEIELFEGSKLRSWAYNGTVPGPEIRMTLGESLQIPFTNELPQPTTIHWHGVRVPNAMDGVPGVSQKPIPPGGEFTYDFTPKDAGTFWFHPHVRGAEQVERGLYGVLIVQDAEPDPFTQDVVWVLDDWKLGPDGQIDPRFVTRHDLAHDGRWGQTVAVNGSTREVLKVDAGSRIRLRLIDTANGRVFRPDLSVLDAKVIAVDGMYTARPLAPAGFVLAPGNRLDLDITIPASAAGTTIDIVDRFTRRVHHLASIEVSERVIETPAFASPARAKVPEWKGAVDRPVDLQFVLDAVRGGEHGISWRINAAVYADGKTHTLVQGRWNKLRFVNKSGRLHPMHIHGQFFTVLERNGTPVDEPYWRDTVLLRPRDTVTVGIVPLDAGRWAMHCHILEHAEAGMMTMLEVRRPGKAAGDH